MPRRGIACISRDTKQFSTAHRRAIGLSTILNQNFLKHDIKHVEPIEKSRDTSRQSLIPIVRLEFQFKHTTALYDDLRSSSLILLYEDSSGREKREER